MLVVILGAGATYDSKPGTPAPVVTALRPPLAAELFTDRFAKHVRDNPAVNALIPELRRAAGEGGASVEQVLERLRNEQETLPDLLPRQLQSLRSYLRDVIRSSTEAWVAEDETTNYVDLVNRIARWSARNRQPATYITFNYDCLIDRAIEVVFGLGFTTMASYTNHPLVHLLKVHGSVNWLREVRGVVNNDPLASAAVLKWTNYYSVHGDPNLSFRRRAADAWWVPAIAIPTLTKDNFECPDEHLNLMRQAMRDAAGLLVIGWRGMEHHFYGTWRAVLAGAGPPTPIGPPRLGWTYVVDRDPSSAQEVAARLYTNGVGALRDAAHTGGFSHFLSDGDRLEDLLAAL